jgi:hypothetical protein
MLRVSAAAALILSTILAIAVFGDIRTISAQGHLHNTMDPHPLTLTTNRSEIQLRTEGGTKNVFDASTAPGYPGDFGFVTNGDIVLTVYVPLPELPRECDVEITHRWIWLAGQLFSSTAVSRDGKTYPIGRSPETFVGTLLVISLAPTILWCLAWVVWLVLRLGKHPTSALE